MLKLRTFITTAGAIFALAAPVAHATDATTVIRNLSPHGGLYQVELENTSGIGFIDTWEWVPPIGMTITTVTGTEGGSCAISSNVLDCRGGALGIAPPSCTCHAGGRMTVNFTAKGNLPTFNGKYWTYYGIGSDTLITSMTPVEYHIPSYLVDTADLPICQLGTQPGPDNNCVVE